MLLSDGLMQTATYCLVWLCAQDQPLCAEICLMKLSYSGYHRYSQSQHSQSIYMLLSVSCTHTKPHIFGFVESMLLDRLDLGYTFPRIH